MLTPPGCPLPAPWPAPCPDRSPGSHARQPLAHAPVHLPGYQPPHAGPPAQVLCICLRSHPPPGQRASQRKVWQRRRRPRSLAQCEFGAKGACLATGCFCQQAQSAALHCLMPLLPALPALPAPALAPAPACRRALGMTLPARCLPSRRSTACSTCTPGTRWAASGGAWACATPRWQSIRWACLLYMLCHVMHAAHAGLAVHAVHA